MGWLKRLIAWAVAGAELAELERWRVESKELRRWMAEFPDACTALDHLERFATGLTYRGLSEVRESMRKRRDGRAAIMEPLVASGAYLDRLAALPLMSDADVARFKQQWSVANDVGAARELVSATDWDVAEQHVRELDQARQHACDAVDRALSDPPTHLIGILPPAPRRVAYKFLSPGCDARS